MMNNTISVLILASLVQVIAAEPSISGISGVVSDGQTIIISGSGFGSKSPVAPITFDNFENGVVGDYLLAHDPRWQSYQGDGKGLTYSSTAPHSGTMALGRHNTAGENFVTNYLTYTPGSQELFVSYWWKVVPVTVGSTVIKMTRLNSSPAAGGGGIYNGTGNTSLGGTYNLASDSGPYCAYNNGAETECPITGSWDTSYFAAPPTSSWFKVDSYKKLSTPGIADGIIDYRIDTQEKGSTAAKTRATGMSFLMDTVLLGTMEGADAPHDYWVYVDDVYIDNTRARVEICDAPHWADRTLGEMQIPHTEWADGQLRVTVNHGSFAAGTTRYIYVVNRDGVVNAAGYPVILGGAGDTTPPTRPAAPHVSDATSAQPTISGVTEPGALVLISDQGVLVATVTADGLGAWVWTADLDTDRGLTHVHRRQSKTLPVTPATHPRQPR